MLQSALEGMSFVAFLYLIMSFLRFLFMFCFYCCRGITTFQNFIKKNIYLKKNLAENEIDKNDFRKTKLSFLEKNRVTEKSKWNKYNNIRFQGQRNQINAGC